MVLIALNAAVWLAILATGGRQPAGRLAGAAHPAAVRSVPGGSVDVDQAVVHRAGGDLAARVSPTAPTGSW